MYWLRRIPAETRIVVLVVFLALFQAMLLSVFGLAAIRGERRAVKDTIQERAKDFLDNFVVAGLQNDLRARAHEVFLEAYGPSGEGWRDRSPEPGRGLFDEAYTLTADGSILESSGRTLLLSAAMAGRDGEVVRATAERMRQQYAQGLVDDRAKPEGDLKFAEQYPFARDDLGHSLALLFAETPLLLGEGVVDAPTLLRMRWIGTLNRLAGFAAVAEIDTFLARIDAAAARLPADARQAYTGGAEEQTARATTLQALAREARAINPPGHPILHRNILATAPLADTGQPALFYARRVASGRETQVLSVRRERLQAVIRGFMGRAVSRAAQEGHKPRVLEPGAASPAGQPSAPLPSMPGYVATAEVSAAAVREQAGGRERIYWYIIACSVAGILAGGFLTARVVMREVKLAKLKSGFVSNVSHELKTPLTSIRMFAEMLGSGNVTDEAERRECLTVITQETDRLSRLIQQVLDFGRLQSRQRRFLWIIDTVATVVEKEAERFRRATGLPPDRFEVQIAVNLPPSRHDADALGEVVANLLSNAYKYTPKTDKRIRVTLGPNQGRVVLAVEDNGPGIAARERRRIFEQFYRTGDLLTREVEGTGLGLSIARTIVRAHGGRILVEDSKLGGSRFLVILPRAEKTR